MNLFMKQEQTQQTQQTTRLVVAKGRGGGGGLDWECEISRGKPLYRE